MFVGENRHSSIPCAVILVPYVPNVLVRPLPPPAGQGHLETQGVHHLISVSLTWPPIKVGVEPQRNYLVREMFCFCHSS